MRRLLIIGCGDVALRMLPLVRGRYAVYGLTRDRGDLDVLRALGLRPVLGDLDRPETLGALSGLAQDVVHLAPPPPRGVRDPRSTHLIATLAKARSLPQHLVYVSTSGVYGDCGGALVDETRPLNPQSERATRRAHAERQLREWGARAGVRVTIVRAPGIYAADRLPIDRLTRGTPALEAQEDSYVNHVHAEDLARIVVAALRRGQPNRTYNACDDVPQRMGDYFDLVADSFGLPRPPRISRSEARGSVSAQLYSFMNESRRLCNGRMKRELRVALRYPSVHEGLAAAAASSGRRSAQLPERTR
jgi:nucleoside-diphosphate-sugar epimerase